MPSQINKINFFLNRHNFFDLIFLFFLTIIIFNFGDIFKRDIIGFLLGFYLLIYYFLNQKLFYNLNHIIYILIFLSYLVINQLYQTYIPPSNENYLNIKDHIVLIFDLLLFSFLILYKKNWVYFFKKLFIIICFFLVLIIIQNYILLDKFIVTNDIFFNYQNYTHNWASKNFLAIILNIFLMFLILNFSKNSFFYFYFIIISVSIILTFSRAGYYIYLLNLIYFLIFLKKSILRMIFIGIFFLLSSVFWNEDAANFYIDKKFDISYLANKDNLDKLTPRNEINMFSKSWFSKDSSSVRVSYFFLTLENLKENFFIGNGLGSFKNENKLLNEDKSPKRYPDPHSTWLALLYEMGFIGLILYLFLILKNKYYILKIKNFSEIYKLCFFLLIITFCSLFINILFTPIVWFLYSMKLNLNNEHKNN